MSDTPKDKEQSAVDQGNNGDIPTRGQQAMLDLGQLQQGFPPVAGGIDPKPMHVSFDTFKKSSLDLPVDNKIEKILQKIREKFTSAKSMLTRLAAEGAGSDPNNSFGAGFANSGLKEVNDILKNIDTAGLSEWQALTLLENTLDQIEHLQAHMKQVLQEQLFEEYETEEFQEIKEFLEALDKEEEQWQKQLEEAKDDLEASMSTDEPADDSPETRDEKGVEKASDADKEKPADGNSEDAPKMSARGQTDKSGKETQEHSVVKEDKQPGRPRPR